MMQLSFSGLAAIKELKSVATVAHHTSNGGLDMIEGFEGCRLKAYLDSAGVATIGWGSTRYADGTRVKMGDTLKSVADADALFLVTLKGYEADVNRMITVPMNANEFDALVSFHYNTGGITAKQCTLRSKLNAGDRQGAADQFLVWNKVKGVVNLVLSKRRAKERALFLTPVAQAA